MRFLRRSLIGIFLLGLTLALLALAANTVREAVVARMSEEPRSFPQRERVFAVEVTEVAPQTLTPVLTAFGEVQSRRSLTLRAAASGTVTDVAEAFVEGGQVREGEVLVRIDDADARAARDRAAANLSDAEAEQRDAERALVLARDDLAGAEEQEVLRETALTRARDLADRGVGTTAAVETAELAVSTAKAAVLSRRQALAQAEARLDQARTGLARAGIDRDEAERTLADTTLTAPFDGALTDVAISPGGRVSANEAVATLLDPDALEVAFRVSTAQYARLLRDGSLPELEVTATLDVAGVDLTARGTLTRVGASVGEGQTGRLLFARLDDAPGFRPGDFVTALVDEPPLEGVAMLPATAVGSDDAVLVVNEDERLDRVEVEVLRRQGDQVIVRADALSGAQVVTTRSPQLGAGIGVQIVEPEAATEEPPEAETIALDAERRARLLSFVSESAMPDEAKARLVAQLEQEEVPAETVTRLEQRMGG